jgi:hypothetical protein
MRAARTITGYRRGESCRAPILWTLVAAAGLVAASCTPPKPAQPRQPREIGEPAHLKDTIGSVARVTGREAFLVQGYGYVTGLDATGTKVMPPGIRQRILDMMHRHRVEKPEEVLSSPDNAAVLVTGLITPGINKGELFDLEVRAIPTTETTSLEGGFLLECDLVRVVSDRGVQGATDVQALGRGSIFVLPFAVDEKSKTQADPRVGRVLAGGKAVKGRPFRLMLLEPSVRTVDQLVRLINARFPGAAKGTADPGRVDLDVPREYQDDKGRFLDLVGALYLREMPDARDQRVGLLIETLKAGKDMDVVATCLEAFGVSVVPSLRALANEPGEGVRYYAGRTLANLQDALAVSVLEPIALNDASEFQEGAVEALGRIRSGLGLGVLSRALNAKSTRVRVAAWQVSSRLAPRSFVARSFRDKFTLNVVASKGEPFVYVARTLKPEIAIFGDLVVRPPVLAETRRIVATALDGAAQVTLITRSHGRDYRVEAPLDVRGLIEAMAGPAPTDPAQPLRALDLGYSDVVGVLHEMSRKKALSGPLVLQPLLIQIPGDRPRGRPIGEDAGAPLAPEPVAP